MKFTVTGMSCAACSTRVENAVKKLDGIESCNVNLLTNSMQVEGKVSSESIIAAVEAAGYVAYEENIKKSDIEKPKKENLHFLRLFLSVLLVLFLMYFSMGHMIKLPLPSFFYNNDIAVALFQLILSAFVMIINQRFFINGFRDVFKGSFNMDTLVSLGSSASFIYSVYLTFRMTLGEDHLNGLYFDSAAMILTLISVGKMLEAYSKGKTTNAINALISLKPQKATVVKDGVEFVVDVDNVIVGDIFIIKPGESVPVDGVVVEGFSSVDESMLTGESISVDKNINDKVSAATINLSGFLKCKATHVGEETLLAKIIKTVSDASSSKAPIAKIADKVSGVFVPIVIFISIITFIIWYIISNDFSFSFERAISILVVSCPCALGLATPVAIMVGSGVAAKKGILFKTAQSLEFAGKINIVTIDKTGTLTKGKPEVTDIFSNEADKLLLYAYSVERKSEHPLARAIVKKAEQDNIQPLEIYDFIAHSGHGVSCVVNGKILRGGNIDFVLEDNNSLYLDKANEFSKEGKTPLLFSLDNELLGIIAVSDTLKEDSFQAIQALNNLNIKTVMLTGDNEVTASVIASKSGIKEFKASVLPQDKSAIINELKKAGNVAMVGDGINDAPALASSDIGIAVGAGADIAIDSADIVLMNSSLMDAYNAILIGKAVLKTIKQNLFWAFIYNCIGIPLAAGVFIPLFDWGLNPMFCAAAMSLSSFFVVTNALRLNLIKLDKKEKKMKKVVKIGGMMCGHCEARVKKILETFPQVDEAIVSHKKGTAILSLNSELDDNEIKKIIENDGYSFG